jgi:hypothetical protein
VCLRERLPRFSSSSPYTSEFALRSRGHLTWGLFRLSPIGFCHRSDFARFVLSPIGFRSFRFAARLLFNWIALPDSARNSGNIFRYPATLAAWRTYI